MGTLGNAIGALEYDWGILDNFQGILRYVGGISWYVEDAWENMSYLPGLLEFTRLWLWCIYYHFSVLWYSGNHLVKGLLENTSVLILTTNGISGNCVEFRL